MVGADGCEWVRLGAFRCGWVQKLVAPTRCDKNGISKRDSTERRGYCSKTDKEIKNSIKIGTNHFRDNGICFNISKKDSKCSMEFLDFPQINCTEDAPCIIIVRKIA